MLWPIFVARGRERKRTFQALALPMHRCPRTFRERRPPSAAWLEKEFQGLPRRRARPLRLRFLERPSSQDPRWLESRVGLLRASVHGVRRRELLVQRPATGPFGARLNGDVPFLDLQTVRVAWNGSCGNAAIERHGDRFGAVDDGVFAQQDHLPTRALHLVRSTIICARRDRCVVSQGRRSRASHAMA